MQVAIQFAIRKSLIDSFAPANGGTAAAAAEAAGLEANSSPPVGGIGIATRFSLVWN